MSEKASPHWNNQAFLEAIENAKKLFGEEIVSGAVNYIDALADFENSERDAIIYVIKTGYSDEDWHNVEELAEELCVRSMMSRFKLRHL